MLPGYQMIKRSEKKNWQSVQKQRRERKREEKNRMVIVKLFVLHENAIN